MADEQRDAIEPGADDDARACEPTSDGEVDQPQAEATLGSPVEADASDELARVDARTTDDSATDSETATQARADSGSADSGMDDAAGVSDDPERAGQEESPDELPLDGDRERSPQRIALELKRIETDVRKLLEDRDPRRKRRLGGSRRWSELEEDLIALRFAGRMEESTIATLRQLIDRRHYLFGRLRFLAMTRPTWNS